MLDNSLESLNLMSMNDRELFIIAERVKESIANFIDRKVMIQKIRELIDNSEVIEFYSQRTRKYISLTRPVFIVRVNESEFKKKYNRELTETNEIYDLLNNIIFEDIIRNYTKFLLDIVRSDKFTTALRSKLKNMNCQIDPALLEDLSELSEFAVSSSFQTLMKLDTNMIHIVYVF